MKVIAASIVVFSGAIMASAGTLAEAMPDARRRSVVDEWGLCVVVVGGLLLMAEMLNRSTTSSSK